MTHPSHSAAAQQWGQTPPAWTRASAPVGGGEPRPRPATTRGPESPSSSTERRWRNKVALRIIWCFRGSQMSPEFVPSSVSQSLHYDYNQNQNVIFKQLPRTFLNISKHSRSSLVPTLLCKVSQLQSQVGGAGLAQLCSHNIFNARLLSPEQMTRPININRRKGKERSDFWQQKGNGSLQAMLSPKMLVSWPWSWFTF